MWRIGRSTHGQFGPSFEMSSQVGQSKKRLSLTMANGWIPDNDFRNDGVEHVGTGPKTGRSWILSALMAEARRASLCCRTRWNYSAEAVLLRTPGAWRSGVLAFHRSLPR